MRGEEKTGEEIIEEKLGMPLKIVITVTTITVMTYLTSRNMIRIAHSHRRERAQETPARWWTFLSQAPDI